MKELINFCVKQEDKDMFDYILTLLRGKVVGGLRMTERNRQFYTWGATSFGYIRSKCGCYGIQFKVSGLKFRGRVRVWYNPSSDYFDIEFVRAIKNELVSSFEDIDLSQLHDVCHRFIEREDDPCCG